MHQVKMEPWVHLANRGDHMFFIAIQAILHNYRSIPKAPFLLDVFTII